MSDFKIETPKITSEFINKFLALERPSWNIPSFPNISYHTEVKPNKELTETILSAPSDYYETRVIMNNYKGKEYVNGYVIVDVQNKDEAEFYDMAVFNMMSVIDRNAPYSVMCQFNSDERLAKGLFLISEAEDIAREHGCKTISLTTNKGSEIAHHKYLAIKGFNAVAEDTRKNTVTFKKDLTVKKEPNRPNYRY